MAISNFPHGVRSQILLVTSADVQRELFLRGLLAFTAALGGKH